MDEIKKIIDDLAIEAFEANTKIASLAIISDSGYLIYQTENWDLSSYTDIILNVINGERIFVINNMNFSVVETSPTGIIASSESGMGHAIYALFQGGVLVSYVKPGGDPHAALNFLNKFCYHLSEKI